MYFERIRCTVYFDREFIIAWKVSVFRVFLNCFFPHSIQKNSEYGPFSRSVQQCTCIYDVGFKKLLNLALLWKDYCFCILDKCQLLQSPYFSLVLVRFGFTKFSLSNSCDLRTVWYLVEIESILLGDYKQQHRMQTKNSVFLLLSQNYVLKKR